MKKLSLILIIITLFWSAHGLCNFPCDWYGRTFVNTDPVNTTDPTKQGHCIFNRNNQSIADCVNLSGPITLVCEAIIDSHIIMRWYDASGEYRVCITVQILSPDAFMYLLRSRVEKTVEKFCDICYQEERTTSYLFVSRADGPGKNADPTVFKCKGPKTCVKTPADVCSNLPDLIPCGESKVQQPRYYKSRPRYQHKNRPSYKQRSYKK